MDQANFWVMSIIGPAILLIVLIWLVLRVRSNRNTGENRHVERNTSNLYAEEEQRRRDGTDTL